MNFQDAINDQTVRENVGTAMREPERPVTPLSVMIAQYRVAFRLSLRDFEQLTGLDHTTLLRLEVGTTMPTLATWLRFSAWLFTRSLGDATPLGTMLLFYRRHCGLTHPRLDTSIGLSEGTTSSLECDQWFDAAEWLRLQEWLLSPVLMAAFPASLAAHAPLTNAASRAGSDASVTTQPPTG